MQQIQICCLYYQNINKLVNNKELIVLKQKQGLHHYFGIRNLVQKGWFEICEQQPISICIPVIHTMRCFGHLLCFEYHSVATHEKKNLSSGRRTKTMVLNSSLSQFELPECLTQLLRESIKSANIVRIKTKCTFKE